ncbi:hypothetical protein PESP_a3889 [Pseudoalteromonas espejiana DSM 9414]|nr:hypothetical protein PESP_a3889 [Pseudoalteromonas espejiana DSM 9414]
MVLKTAINALLKDRLPQKIKLKRCHLTKSHLVYGLDLPLLTVFHQLKPPKKKSLNTSN